MERDLTDEATDLTTAISNTNPVAILTDDKAYSAFYERVRAHHYQRGRRTAPQGPRRV